MLPSTRNVLVALLSTVVVIPAVHSQQEKPVNYSDPYVGAALEHYLVVTDDPSTTKFVCINDGSRCQFKRSNYQSIDFGTGQETENEQGAVWAATNPDSVLTLGPCSNVVNGVAVSSDDDNDCVVTCNANCTCAYIMDDTTDPQLCDRMETRVPTPTPKTAAPVPLICPEEEFTEFCPTLMNSPLALPDGVVNNYDCFTFCGGIWVGTCDYGGTCGTQDCTNKTATGTLNGLVKGCTIQQYNEAERVKASKATRNGDASTTTSGGDVVFYRTFVLLIVFISTSTILSIC